MKPLNKAERWYLYLWLFITEDFEAYQDSGHADALITAGREIKDGKRHTELQKYGAFLLHETYE